MFSSDPTFTLDRVASASRHGPLPDGSHKISLRYWVDGYKIRPEHMLSLIDSCAPPERRDFFDRSIYNKKRLLAVVGGCKGYGDHRVLDVEDRSQAHRCLTQLVEEGAQLLDFPEEAQKTPGTMSRALEDWGALTVALIRAGFRDPCYKGKRENSTTFSASNQGVDCPCCSNVHDKQCWMAMHNPGGWYLVKSYSPRCRSMTIAAEPQCEEIVVPSALSPGCQHLPHMGFEQAPIPSDATACQIVMQHLETCPLCKANHNSDKWYLETLVNECFTLRNSEQICKARLMWCCGPDKPIVTNPHLHDIFISPTTHSPYGELYLEEHQGNLISDDAGHLYEFTAQGRWQHRVEQQVANSIQNWYKTLFDKFFHLFSNEDTCTRDFKELDRIRKEARKAHGHILNENAVGQVMKAIKRKVYVENLHDKLDMQHSLIAFDNGVFELDTGKFRQGRKEDMISKSAGYNFEEAGGEDMLAVEAFMDSIYPVEEEREIARLYFGYCLTGDHRAKKLAFLTDGGGSRGGYNGKTTIAKALHATLGDDYSIKGKEAFLYRNDSSSETANSHNAGDLVYKGKRAAMFEELSVARHLNDAKIKDLNGS
ncbi:hypothetical protein WJX77_004059 [Trebouxia sp. C0004]